MRFKVLSWLVVWLLLLAGCGATPMPGDGAAGAPSHTTTPSTAGAASPAETREVVVFTAASLTEAFTALGAQFEAANPGTKVTFNIAGSQQLAQQLGQGAPADIFASANQKQMDVAVEAGRVVSGTAQTFVRNRLVVIFPPDNPAGLERLDDLGQAGLKLVLAAPEVPVGQYSIDFLDKAVQAGSFGADFKARVIGNVVSYEENVRAVLSKVALGEADAGIVYSSDIASEETTRLGRLDIPDALNTIADYPIALVSDSQHPDLAQTFISLVLSPEGQGVLAAHGFIPVTP